MHYRFNRFDLDTDKQELRADGELVAVEPQVFDVLHHLVENRDRMVSRDELIEAVWDGRIVSDAAISARINAVRRVLGDSGARQEILKTVPRRGFRFLAPVELVGNSPSDVADDAASAITPPADKPSIAVLPFDNLSGDPEQDYFADGMSDDIITELSRYPDLLVIARHSTYAYKETPTDPKVIGRQLGVRYVLEGGVRRAGERLRISAQLIDAATGHHIWAQRYDREVSDVFELQEEISRVIAGAVGVRVHESDAARHAHSDDASLSAYDLTHRAYFRWQALGPEDISATRDYAHQAIAIEPAYSRAYSMLAWTYTQDRFSAFGEDADQALELAFEMATKAVALDRSDARAAVIFALVLSQMEQHDRALAELERAEDLSPSLAEIYAVRGLVFGFMGRVTEANEAVDMAVRLNPHSPGWYHLMRGRAYLAVRRPEDAVAPLESAISLTPTMPQIHAALAVAYAGVGRKEDARATVAAIRALNPRFTCSHVGCVLPYVDKSVLEEQLAVLAEAGLPA